MYVLGRGEGCFLGPWGGLYSNVFLVSTPKLRLVPGPPGATHIPPCFSSTRGGKAGNFLYLDLLCPMWKPLALCGCEHLKCGQSELR